MNINAVATKSRRYWTGEPGPDGGIDECDGRDETDQALSSSVERMPLIAAFTVEVSKPKRNPPRAAPQ